MFPNGPDEPHLRHAHDGTENTETECQDGGDPGGEEILGGVVGHVVALDAALEDEVFGERDAFIDGEPVALGSVRRGKWVTFRLNSRVARGEEE